MKKPKVNDILYTSVERIQALFFSFSIVYLFLLEPPGKKYVSGVEKLRETEEESNTVALEE